MKGVEDCEHLEGRTRYDWCAMSTKLSRAFDLQLGVDGVCSFDLTRWIRRAEMIVGRQQRQSG